jgi:microcystin degradation protein MlrC
VVTTLKRIVIAGIFTECNDFTSAFIETSDFERAELLRGDQILQRSDGIVGGTLNELSKHPEFTPVPLLFASASPGGALTDSCYFELSDEILLRLKEAGDVDGVLLLLHGAAVTQSVDDLEGDLLARVREIVGNDIPIMVTLDLHAHITEEMVRLSTALFGWETYPHMDSYTTGARAADLMARTLKGEVRPVQVMAKVPVLTSAINASTERPGPFFDLMKKAKDLEHSGKVLSSSVFLVHPYIDRPNMGSGALIVTDNRPAEARAYANELAQEYWDRRVEFEPEVWKPDEAVEKALSESSAHVVLTEAADCCGGGAAGDCVATLHALLDSEKVFTALYPVVSPQAASQAHRAGVGSGIHVTIGSEIDKKWGPPVEVDAEVISLSDGEFTYVGGIWNGASGRMGPSAVLRVRGIDILVTTHATYEWHDEQYRSMGLNPSNYKIIVAKNPMNYFMTYKDLTDIFLIVDSPGPTPATCLALTYKKMQRPFFPFDSEIPGVKPHLFGATN